MTFKKKHDNIIRTQDIFYELMISLDRNAGGEWADNLYAVYEFINHRLVESKHEKRRKIMDEVIPLIEEIRNLWNEAYKLSVKK